MGPLIFIDVFPVIAQTIQHQAQRPGGSGTGILSFHKDPIGLTVVIPFGGVFRLIAVFRHFLGGCRDLFQIGGSLEIGVDLIGDPLRHSGGLGQLLFLLGGGGGGRGGRL